MATLPEMPGEPSPLAVLLAVSTSGAAAALAPALPAVTGKTTWVTGFDVTGGGATGASVIDINITGLATAIGTLHWGMNVLAGATGPVNTQGGLSIRFPTPLSASAVASAITLNVPSFGTGNTEAAAVIYGFSQ